MSKNVAQLGESVSPSLAHAMLAAMNTILFFAAFFLAADFLVNFWIERKNQAFAPKEVPSEFQDLYDSATYARSRDYLRERSRLGLWSEGISALIWITILFSGGLLALDTWVLAWGQGPIISGLYFFALISLVGLILDLPFSALSTFGVEARFGFNRTTIRTFILDRVKGLALSVILGGAVVAIVLAVLHRFGADTWLYVWAGLQILQVILLFLAPAFLFPLFYKFEPLPEGEVKQAITTLAQRLDFPIEGLYRMDGSSRSTKANAFFAGFGKFRRIVLFDTLLATQTKEEITAVLAHEIGHYKLRHVWRTFALSMVVQAGLIWFMVYVAFRVSPQNTDFLSLHLGLFVASLLFQPLSRLLALAGNALSRKHEYEADHFAVNAVGSPEPLVSGLKKLSRDALANLTPHPWKVVAEYSHPPLLERIRAMRAEST